MKQCYRFILKLLNVFCVKIYPNLKIFRANGINKRRNHYEKKKWLLISILAAVVLLALVGCQAETFTVAFDTDGGSAIASLTVEKGKEIECPAEPEKSGYRFDGWYKDQDRTELFDFSNEKINGNATLFAKWIKVFEVGFDTDGGSAVSSAIVDSGSLAIRPADPSKAGKNFGGWYKEKECINKFYFNEPILSDMTLFAKWVDQITYTVNFLRRKL